MLALYKLGFGSGGLCDWQKLHFSLCDSFRTGSWRWRSWFYPLTTALSGTAPGLLGCGLGTCWPWRGTGLSTASSLVRKEPANAVQGCSLHSKQPGTNGTLQDLFSSCCSDAKAKLLWLSSFTLSCRQWTAWNEQSWIQPHFNSLPKLIYYVAFLLLSSQKPVELV